MLAILRYTNYYVSCLISFADSAGFAQIYLPCTAQLAIDRNAGREDAVTKEVIVAMDAKLEPPNPSNHWESHSIEWKDGDSMTCDL